MKAAKGEEITVEEVQTAIKRRNNKAEGPSGVVADMLKAAGDYGHLYFLKILTIL